MRSKNSQTNNILNNSIALCYIYINNVQIYTSKRKNYFYWKSETHRYFLLSGGPGLMYTVGVVFVIYSKHFWNIFLLLLCIRQSKSQDDYSLNFYWLSLNRTRVLIAESLNMHSNFPNTMPSTVPSDFHPTNPVISHPWHHPMHFA